jgi:large subunit ribosomal protein L21
MTAFFFWCAIGAVAGTIFGSFFEWALHRYIMHRPFAWFRFPYETHTLIHHRIFRADHTYHLWFNFRPFAGKFMYAVLETGSKQYRVAAGDKLEIERLETEAGKPVTFDRVLLVNNDGKLAVGAPTVTGATVVADVVEHKRGEKKLTFKMKRRKGYHKTIGHRQELTVVKITAINA